MNVVSYLKEDQYHFINSTSEKRSDKITFTRKKVESKHLNGEVVIYTYRGFCCLGYKFDVLQDCHEQIIIDSEFIQISFALAGRSLVLNKERTVKMQSGHVQLAYLAEHTVDIKMLSKEKRVNHIRFIISKEFFLEMMKNVGWNVKDSFINKIINGQHMMFGDVSIAAELELLSSLKVIMDNEYTYPVDGIFLKNKITEILIRIHHLFENKESYLNISRTNKSESEQLEKGRKYIEKNYNNPPTIKDLSKIIYLNEFKLKKGFKQLYGHTIHEYITLTRMKKAKELLGKKLPVSEVGGLLGYKTSSHFIQSFKKHFGHTPKQLKVILLLVAEKILLTGL